MSVGKLTAREIKRIEPLVAAYEQTRDDLAAALQDTLDEWHRSAGSDRPLARIGRSARAG
jgi:hypothetical protein